MSKIGNIISPCFKHLTFVLVLATMIAQPICDVIDFFAKADLELVAFEIEKESDKKEKKEENNKHEKKEISHSSTYYAGELLSFTRSTFHAPLFSNLHSEINLPPPDLG